MPVRMSGLISNMDTESIIKELMKAQRTKQTKVENKKTKLEWTQDKWKELNTKIYKLYTDSVSKMRLQSSYQTKTAVSSNESIAKITANTTSASGTHTLAVKQLASSQYVTSGKLDSTVNSSTKLKDAVIGMTSTNGNDTVIKITNGTAEKNLIVTDTTTIGDFVSACQEIGLNASYDNAQQRFFISSKTSGEENKFTITTGEISNTATVALGNIHSLVSYSSIGATGQSSVSEAIKLLEGKTEAELDALYQSAVDGTAGADAAEQKAINAVKTLRDYAIKKAEADVKSAATKQTRDEIKASILSKYSDPDADTLATLETQIQSEIDAGTLTLPAGTTVTDAAIERHKQNQAVLDELKEEAAKRIESGDLTIPEGKTKEEVINETAQIQFDTFVQMDKTMKFNSIMNTKMSTDESKARIEEIYNTNIAAYTADALTGANGLSTQLKTYVANASVDNNNSADNLGKIGLGEIDGSMVATSTSDKMTVVKAEDAIIVLDGAELTAKSNSFTAAGISFDLVGKTAVGETVNLTISDNKQGTYDMIKGFIKEYNAILKEMNTLYYANSAKGYEPLTSEEKEAMSDDEIEKWETKIKDSLLRRDDTLGGLINAMKSAISSTVKVKVGGVEKEINLATYGIMTSTDYTEKGLLHIYGDMDDPTYSLKTDKLLAALSEDPETVADAFANIAKNLYDTMTEKMKSSTLSSALTFYNDKQMAKQVTTYTKEISKWEDRLQKMEDKYYKQYSAMETALAKLQSQQSALSGLLGMSS